MSKWGASAATMVVKGLFLGTIGSWELPYLFGLKIVNYKLSPHHHPSFLMRRSLEDIDPLTLAIAPPPDETPEQRQIREAAEAEAKRVSDEIDEQIRKERELDKKKKKPMKLLLLGQYPQTPNSESDPSMFFVQARAKVARPPH